MGFVSTAAARRANGTVHIKLGEESSFFGETINVRRFQLRVSVTTEVAPAKVVRQNENKIGTFAGMILRPRTPDGGNQRQRDDRKPFCEHAGKMNRLGQKDKLVSDCRAWF